MVAAARLRLPSWHAVLVHLLGATLCLAVTLNGIQQVWKPMDAPSLPVLRVYNHDLPLRRLYKEDRADISGYVLWRELLGSKYAAIAGPITGLMVGLKEAQARPHGSRGPTGSPGCAGDAYHAVDGCDGAPTGGSFQDTSYLSTYPSGHSYTATPPWYLAGINYAIAIPAASFPLKDPTINSLPTGCASGSNINCTSGANITLDGYDFGNTSGTGGCIRLNLQGLTGTTTVRNSKLTNGSNCDVSNGDLIRNTSAAALVIENSELDGHADLFPYNFASMVNNNSLTSCTTVRYNKWSRAPARMLQTNSTCSPMIAYNFMVGWAYAKTANVTASAAPGTNVLTFAGGVPSGVGGSQTAVDRTAPTALGNGITVSSVTATTVTLGSNIPAGPGVTSGDEISFGSAVHAEFALHDTDKAHSNSAPLISYLYNVFSQPTAAIGLETTAEIYISSGQTGPTWTQADIIGNTMLSNRILNNRNLVAALLNFQQATITTTNITNNYFDPYGAFFCLQNLPSGTKNISGNVNMSDGSTVDASTCNNHN